MDGAIDKVGRAVDITRPDSAVSRSIDGLAEHADVTNPRGALGVLGSVVTGPDTRPGFGSGTFRPQSGPSASTAIGDARISGAIVGYSSSDSMASPGTPMTSEISRGSVSPDGNKFNDDAFARLLPDAFDKMELIFLAWETLGEHLPIDMTVAAIADETMKRIADRPMEKALLVAQAAKDRPGRTDEFFTAYRMLAANYSEFALPIPLSPKELNLDEIAARFGSKRPVPTGFHRNAFYLLAATGRFGDTNELADTARGSIGADMPKPALGDLGTAAKWLLDVIGNDGARQTLFLANILRKRAKAEKNVDMISSFYAGVTTAYDMPPLQDPKDIDLDAIATHFGIHDYAQRIAPLKITTPRGVRYVSEDELFSLARSFHSASAANQVLKAANYATSARAIDYSIKPEDLPKLAVRLITKNESGRGDPVLLLQEIRAINPFREDVRRQVADILGETYEPLPASRRYPGSPRLGATQTGSDGLFIYSVANPNVLATLYDLCHEAWGSDPERIRSLYVQLDMKEILPSSDDVGLLIWELLGGAFRRGIEKKMLAVLAADFPTRLPLQDLSHHRGIEPGVPSRPAIRSGVISDARPIVVTAQIPKSSLADVGLAWEGRHLAVKDRDQFAAYLRESLQIDERGHLSLAAVIFADLNLELDRGIFIYSRDGAEEQEAAVNLATDIEREGIADAFLVRLHERRQEDARTAALAQEILAPTEAV